MLGILIVAVTEFRRGKKGRAYQAKLEANRIEFMHEDLDTNRWEAMQRAERVNRDNGGVAYNIAPPAPKQRPRTSSLTGGWPDLKKVRFKYL